MSDKNPNGLYSKEEVKEPEIKVKPATTKIRSIQSIAIPAKGGTSIMVLGLAGDDKVYKWNQVEEQWEI